MSGLSRTVLAMLAVTVLAGAAGGWLGVRYGLRQDRSAAGLHELLHHQLKLSAQQQQQLEAMERDYGARRKQLEDQMRAANRELATAIRTQHGYGPDAQQAIGHFHEAMRQLQEQTIRHVLDMRTVLTPDQARQFDQAVARALEQDQA